MTTIRSFSEVQSALGVAMLLPQVTAKAGFRATANAAALISSSFIFQYHPESLSDQQGTNYENIQIPGGSHPIYQWVSLGPRVISFSAQFTSDRAFPLPALDVGNRHNVDINGVFAALRYLYYPLYDPSSDFRSSPPIRLFLVLPGTMLGHIAPPVPVIMTDMGMEIQQWHPSGQPKIATVNLTFNEIRQTSTGGVQFVGRDIFEIPKLAYNPIAIAARRHA